MPNSFAQSWPAPASPRPIVILGAGGIVNDAHLPAYRKAGFPVAGIFDVDAARAKSTADRFGIPVVRSLHSAFALKDAVFDLAVPPDCVLEVLEEAPEHAAILIQKPMGRSLDDARKIRDLCRKKRLRAAVNFQLRYSPMMLALRDAISQGLLGELLDVEFRLCVNTPWHLFPFLKKLDRVEILVHSIHYLDFVRHLLGEPTGAYARTVQHPRTPDLKSTKSAIILDYGPRVRCVLSINHDFEFGPAHESATLNVQGTKGAAIITLGLLLNYPQGKPETFGLRTGDGEWEHIPLTGQWFPDAFIGTMASLQRFVSGEDKAMWTNVEDAFKTMALVEACYRSDASGGTPIPD